MLFDLRGRRRRAVQATYLTLAVLMGGGLVLFGIGGDVTGGLLSEGGIFSGDGGSSQAEEEQDERLREAEADLRSNPQNAEALATVFQEPGQEGQGGGGQGGGGQPPGGGGQPPSGNR